MESVLRTISGGPITGSLHRLSICISVRCERCSSLRTTFGHHPVVLTGKPRAKESLCFAKLCSSTGAQASLMAYSDISACQTASLRFAILSCILHAALRCRLSVLMLRRCYYVLMAIIKKAQAFLKTSWGSSIQSFSTFAERPCKRCH